MQLRIRDLALAELPCRTRLPFRFGSVTVTEAPLLHCRVLVESVDGRSAVGMSSDLLVPKWFRKDLERDAAADQEALRTSVRTAAQLYLAHGFQTVYEHWHEVQRQCVEQQAPWSPGLLEAGFGVALVERAVIDAACRLARKSFWAALGNDLFRRRPNAWLPKRGATDPSAFLPGRPLEHIVVRHTVGRLDPLRRSDVPAAERLDDGMPQALDEVLARHGVRWLKIKIGGGHDHDVLRLCAIGALLDELALDTVKVTLDGNEQFASVVELREVWGAADADPHGRSLLQRVQWVEQPLPRAAEPAPDGSATDVKAWTECPLVLDEGDVQESTWHASAYAGVSVKNCKGVFRALRNREEVLWKQELGERRFQTSEDLTNLPVLALQQDLCTASCLELAHSERNGHHYFPGLAHLPPAVVDAALDAHPDLYERTDRGARLRIEAGSLSIRSLHGIGYGADQSVVDALGRALAWNTIRD